MPRRDGTHTVCRCVKRMIVASVFLRDHFSPGIVDKKNNYLIVPEDIYIQIVWSSASLHVAALLDYLTKMTNDMTVFSQGQGGGKLTPSSRTNIVCLSRTSHVVKKPFHCIQKKPVPHGII